MAWSGCDLHPPPGNPCKTWSGCGRTLQPAKGRCTAVECITNHEQNHKQLHSGNPPWSGPRVTSIRLRITRAIRGPWVAVHCSPRRVGVRQMEGIRNHKPNHKQHPHPGSPYNTWSVCGYTLQPAKGRCVAFECEVESQTLRPGNPQKRGPCGVHVCSRSVSNKH